MNTNTAKVNSKRNDFLDFIRGILIILVVWGHAIQYFMLDKGSFYDDPVYKIIYSFHMPLFMVISGYVFYWSVSRSAVVPLLKKRIISIGMPMVLWGMLCWCMNREGLFINEPIKALYALKTDLFSLWFLWSVLVCSVSITVFHNLHGISALLWIAFSICILHVLPNADLNLFMYPYFLFGYCLNRFQIKQCRYKYVVFVLYFVMLMFYSKKHFIYITGNRLFGNTHLVREQFENILFRYTIGMCGCVVAVYIFRALYHITSKTMVGSRIIMIGKYSMQIYICQHFLLEHIGGKVYKLITQKMQYNFLASNRVLFDLVLCPLIAICLSALIIYICKWLETNTQLSRILFGR